MINELFNKNFNFLKNISEGSVVAIISDFSASTINILIRLIVLKYNCWGLKKFMGKEYDGILRKTFVIENNKIIKFNNTKNNLLLQKFRLTKCPGIIFFSSGTTGSPTVDTS